MAERRSSTSGHEDGPFEPFSSLQPAVFGPEPTVQLQSPSLGSLLGHSTKEKEEYYPLKKLLATKGGSNHFISLHCGNCHRILAHPHQIAHISVKERGDRIIWTRLSDGDPHGAVFDNLAYLGNESIHWINTQRMRYHGYSNTTIWHQHVLCKCKHVKGKASPALKQFCIGYALSDQDPHGVGYLDLDHDYRLAFRFSEKPYAPGLVVWAGDQSQHSLDSSILPDIPVEAQERLVAKLEKDGILTFPKDREEKQEEIMALAQKMFFHRTCTKHYNNDSLTAEETVMLLKEVRNEKATEREETSTKCYGAMETKTGACKHGMVIIVGEPAAGKTSFRRAVMGENFCEDSDSTEGISVTTTAAKLTDHAQQDSALFQPTTTDGVLVQAFTQHVKEVSSGQSPHKPPAAKASKMPVQGSSRAKSKAATNPGKAALASSEGVIRAGPLQVNVSPGDRSSLTLNVFTAPVHQAAVDAIGKDFQLMSITHGSMSAGSTHTEAIKAKNVFSDKEISRIAFDPFVAAHAKEFIFELAPRNTERSYFNEDSFKQLQKECDGNDSRMVERSLCIWRDSEDGTRDLLKKSLEDSRFSHILF